MENKDYIVSNNNKIWMPLKVYKEFKEYGKEYEKIVFKRLWGVKHK